MPEVSELGRLAAEYGVVMQPGGFGGGGLVYLGETTADPQPSVQIPFVGAPGFQTMLNLTDTTSSVDALATELFTMSAERIRGLQERLFAAGFYAGVPAEAITPGVADEVTVGAYGTALERAASFYAAGQKMTVDEVIDQAAAARAAAGVGAGAGANIVGGGNTYVIDVADPASLRLLADDVAAAVLGRDATEEEQAAVVGAVQTAQARQQQAVMAAREGQEAAIFGARGGGSGGVRQGQLAAPTAGGTTMSPKQIAEAARAVGFTGDALVNAVAIALAESRGRVDAHNPHGEDSRGLWQINLDAHPQYDGNRLLSDPIYAAQAAFEVSGGGTNFRPWTTFAGTTASGRHNPHTAFLSAAQQGVAELGEGGAAAAPLDPSTPIGGGTGGATGGFIPPVSVTQTAVDPRARAIELLEQRAPEESGAKRIADTYNDFLSIILNPLGAR